MISEYREIKIILDKEERIIQEIEKIFDLVEKTQSESEKRIFTSQMASLEKNLRETSKNLKVKLDSWDFSKPLDLKLLLKKKKKEEEREKLKTKGGKFFSFKEIKPKGLELETIDRIKKSKKEKEEEKKKPKDEAQYSEIASRFFSKYSQKLLSGDSFKKMERELIKANLSYTPVGYVSIIIMTTFLSAIVGGFLFFFFLFFNFSATFPIVTRATETLNIRFLKVFWILFLVPISTFLLMYLYPSLEKKTAALKINQELPFATISMSAISGSMVNPIQIFQILISTEEYPALKKEFTKMINEINLYGYDLVSALKNTAKNSPSKRLGELLNGLATTINSGGDLPKFFDERAQTFLFNYRINQERLSKMAETFMDIYISILIAAPMILMLLLIIMKISGLGIPFSFLAIGLVIILGVVVVNVIFLTFLHLKRNK